MLNSNKQTKLKSEMKKKSVRLKKFKCSTEDCQASTLNLRVNTHLWTLKHLITNHKSTLTLEQPLIRASSCPLWLPWCTRTLTWNSFPGDYFCYNHHPVTLKPAYTSRTNLINTLDGLHGLMSPWGRQIPIIPFS